MRETIIVNAMQQFWRRGYEALSMDMLVKAMNTNRHAIYSDFGGKQELYLACLDAYQREIVTPAFHGVEEEGAGLEAIESYFECQISFAELAGLPGPGCLIANSMTELAPHDDGVMQVVQGHNNRLQMGFLNVLTNVNRTADRRTERELEELASFLMVSAQGLWSMSRTIADGSVLRRYASNLIYLVEAELHRG